jgi:hypothetical protein
MPESNNFNDPVNKLLKDLMNSSEPIKEAMRSMKDKKFEDIEMIAETLGISKESIIGVKNHEHVISIIINKRSLSDDQLACINQKAIQLCTKVAKSINLNILNLPLY